LYEHPQSFPLLPLALPLPTLALLLLRLNQRRPSLIQQARLLRRIHALHTPQVRDLLRERLAFVRLQGADEMPADGAREELRFLEEFLLVVFAEVQVRGRGGVQGEDVGRGFEFGDGYEADLWGVGGGRLVGGR